MKNFCHICCLMIVSTLFVHPLMYAQKKAVDDFEVAGLEVIGKDTLPSVKLPALPVKSRQLREPADMKAYLKLQRNLIKVYPYAQKSYEIFDDVLEQTSKMKKKRHRKKYIRSQQKQFKTEFKDKLKKLSVSQGKTLIKLVERHTGESFFKLIKQFKNPVTAFFWQNIGKTFGYNLKEGYDPAKYAELESLVSFIEDEGLNALRHHYVASIKKYRKMKKTLPPVSAKK